MTDTDPLWRYIHGIVNERVPVEHRATVTDLVAKTTVFILTKPEFLYGLRIVQELQEENERLRRAVVSLQTVHMPKPRKRAAPRKKAAAKRAPAKAAPKRAPAKKNAAAKKIPAKQTRAFKKGLRDR